MNCAPCSTLASAPTPNIITGGDIKALSTKPKIDIMRHNGSLLKSMVYTVNDMGVPVDVQTRLVGELRTSLILKFFKKLRKLDKVSAESLASKCFPELLEFAATEVQNPWADHVGAENKCNDTQQDKGNDTQAQSSVAPASNVVQYQDGKAVGVHCMLLAKKGFHMNSLIQFKETGAHHNF